MSVFASLWSINLYNLKLNFNLYKLEFLKRTTSAVFPPSGYYESMQELLSIVLIAQRSRHLIDVTLDSLAEQEEKNFEVILLDLVGSAHEFADEHRFVLKTYEVEHQSLSLLMNRGLELAQGAYVQFLFPGDHLLTSEATRSIARLASENHSPDLIYCAYLQRDPKFLPRAATHPLDLKLLKKGMTLTMPRTYWFLKESVRALGGFDPRCQYRPSFDLLCRLIADQKMRTVFTRRVLTDTEWHRRSAAEAIHYATDSCRILRRHFGLFCALRYLFVQDHRQMARSTRNFLKEAFWSGPKSFRDS